MFTGMFVLVAAGGLFWLAYRRPRPRRWLLPRPAGVPRLAGASVDRQHRFLHAGGRIGETALEAAKDRLGRLLHAGRVNEVERELRAGEGFAVRVRALAELGTPSAGVVLERQLGRPLSRDPVEQSWYWVDLAAGLRRLNHHAALPAVLACLDRTATAEQTALLAAEAVAFPTFADALDEPASPVGRLALRAAAAAVRGARDGVVEPAALVRSRVADRLAGLRPNPDAADPWRAAAVVEADRLFRRLGAWARLLPEDVRPLADAQARRLFRGADRRRRALGDAVQPLLDRFPAAAPDEKAAILRALGELRADVSGLLPGLPNRRAAWWADAVWCLGRSPFEGYGPLLASQAGELLGVPKHAAAVETLLGALRGHRSVQAEMVLVRVASGGEPGLRRAACAALGWWDPFGPARVARCGTENRRHPDPGVRQAALGLLARLGERAAVRSFADGLTSEEPAVRAAAARRVADEGVSWLWPDLTALADDASDADAAVAAAEACERMREDLFGLED